LRRRSLRRHCERQRSNPWRRRVGKRRTSRRAPRLRGMVGTRSVARAFARTPTALPTLRIHGLAPPSLRASAKQSMAPQNKKLDCFGAHAPRNDEANRDMNPYSRHALRPSCWSIIRPSLTKRARGMPGAQCTRSLVCAGVVKYAHQYSQRRHRKTSGIPHAMVLRLMARSCVRKICQNVRTGGSDQPPVAGSEPVVLKGRKSLTGSEGRIRWSSSTRTVAWA
jgi:hypothetical protein